MKKNLFLSLFFFLKLFSDYSIIFVHVGDQIPEYTKTAIIQSRLFNPNARIILLGNKTGLSHLGPFENELKIELFNYEQIEKTDHHKSYQHLCRQKSKFWRYTSERFLYLDDLIDELSLENVFHLENDNMLYANLESLLPIFQKNYPGIGATFDNDDRCIAGFMWIKDKYAMSDLSKYFSKFANRRLNDMQIIGKYKNKFPIEKIDNLPIIMKEYVDDQPMISPHKHSTRRPKSYCKNSETFESIFDAAAIGQFLGGIDPIHKNNDPGFINESCLFNPSILSFSWEKDEEGRLIPYASYSSKKYRIINLHIHCKRLYQFKSMQCNI